MKYNPQCLWVAIKHLHSNRSSLSAGVTHGKLHSEINNYGSPRTGVFLEFARMINFLAAPLHILDFILAFTKSRMQIAGLLIRRGKYEKEKIHANNGMR